MQPCRLKRDGPWRAPWRVHEEAEEHGYAEEHAPNLERRVRARYTSPLVLATPICSSCTVCGSSLQLIGPPHLGRVAHQLGTSS